MKITKKQLIRLVTEAFLKETASVQRVNTHYGLPKNTKSGQVATKEYKSGKKRKIIFYANKDNDQNKDFLENPDKYRDSISSLYIDKAKKAGVVTGSKVNVAFYPSTQFPDFIVVLGDFVE